MDTTSSSRPLSLKEKQRQEREELILQAAEDVLVEKGYYEMSVDEIASRVGIAKGTVYLHFASKEDLVVALFNRDVRKLYQLVEKSIETAPSARTKMEIILELMCGGLVDKRLHMLTAIFDTIDLHKIFIEKKHCLKGSWEQFEALITSVLEEGKAAGEFDPTIATSVMRGAFFSLLSPKSYERLLKEEHVSPTELAEQLGRIYFKGIAISKI
jgi:TetR/AcrR family fatty acid metabolism transcriptional regulator